jgi:hypothetical protein
MAGGDLLLSRDFWHYGIFMTLFTALHFSIIFDGQLVSKSA